MTRPTRSLPIVLLVACLCAGCGDEQEDTIVLRVSNWGGPAVESQFMTLERTLREEFEARHPGVRVQIEQIPGPGQYAPKLLMMHVSGSVPDVIHLDASSAAVFINNNVLRDLTGFVEQDADFDLAAFFEIVLNIARRDQSLFAIPLDFTPMVMYYNKALFDEAGVSYPEPGWTWDDFLAKATQLTIFPEEARSPTRYGFNFENIMPLWVLWLWTGGADVLDPSGRRASGFLDGPESLTATQFLVDLIVKHRVAPNLRERAAAGVDLFRDQRAAMDLKGHWMMIDYRADGIDYGVVGLPTRAGVAPVTVIYESGLAITRKARHPELAWEYIKFMTTKGVQVRRVASGLAISANRQAAAEFAGNPIEDAFIREVRFARPPWGASVERYPFIEGLGEEMMEDLLYSEKPDVRASLRRTANLIDAALTEQ